MEKQRKQLKTLLLLSVLFLTWPTDTSMVKVDSANFNSWYPNQSSKLLKPYASITKHLQHNLHIHLAALLVVMAQNKQGVTK